MGGRREYNTDFLFMLTTTPPFNPAEVSLSASWRTMFSRFEKNL